MEAALVLRTHRVGAFPRRTSCLHLRTAGRIGRPTRLIRQGAITAILAGSERITKTDLDQIGQVVAEPGVAARFDKLAVHLGATVLIAARVAVPRRKRRPRVPPWQ